jgi:hypothetical protein
MIWGALGLIILLAAQAAGSWYFARRIFTAKDEVQRRRLTRQVASFSLAVGCLILVLGLAGLVVLKFTFDGWLVLLLMWSFGLLHLGLLRSSLRRARWRTAGRAAADGSSEGARPA